MYFSLRAQKRKKRTKKKTKQKEKMQRINTSTYIKMKENQANAWHNIDNKRITQLGTQWGDTYVKIVKDVL